MSWNGDLSPDEAEKHIQLYLDEAWRRGPSDNDYLTKAFVQFFIKKDFDSAEKLLRKAIDLSPNNSTVLYTYSYLLNMMGRFDEALSFVNKAKAIDPLTVAYFNYETISLYLLGRYEEAISVLKEASAIISLRITSLRLSRQNYLTLGKYEEAVEAILSGLRDPPGSGPLNDCLPCRGIRWPTRKDKAKTLLTELVNRSEANEKGVNIYAVHAFYAMGDLKSAWLYLEKAKKTNDVDLIWWHVDPLLKNLREQSTNEIDMPQNFDGAEQHIITLLGKEMPNLQYHNVKHIMMCWNQHW